MIDLAALKQTYEKARRLYNSVTYFIDTREMDALSTASDKYVKALEARIHFLETGVPETLTPFDVMRSEFAEDKYALECLVSFWQAYSNYGNPVRWDVIRYHDCIPLLRKWRLIQMIEIGNTYALTERGIDYVNASHGKLKREMQWDNAYSSGYSK